MERGVLVPPNLHKLTLVAPLSMRDDLYSYLLPILLQLFRMLNVCLNGVFEEFILFVFGQVIESLHELMTPFVRQLDHIPWTILYSQLCPRVRLYHCPHQHSLRLSATSSATLAIINES
jgi:hypothetical protein